LPVDNYAAGAFRDESIDNGRAKTVGAARHDDNLIFEQTWSFTHR
jgi:hypothetical protein